uniref:Putative ovule protein n=1 Tax=Solanum chacoense TaxID=4108 RepID=A0A0V0HKA5_SOLCH
MHALSFSCFINRVDPLFKHLKFSNSCLSLPSHPSASQLANVVEMFSGIIHVIPLRAYNILHC